MGTMTVQAIFEAIDSGLAEVSRRLASGELDRSGRYYSDEELASGAALGLKVEPARPTVPLALRPEKSGTAVSG